MVVLLPLLLLPWPPPHIRLSTYGSPLKITSLLSQHSRVYSPLNANVWKFRAIHYAISKLCPLNELELTALLFYVFKSLVSLVPRAAGAGHSAKGKMNLKWTQIEEEVKKKGSSHRRKNCNNAVQISDRGVSWTKLVYDLKSS